MADPLITFTSISGRDVFATYMNLPANSRIVFVNQTSGQSFGGIDVSGSSPVTISVPEGTRGGAYYLKAQDSTGQYLAQTVVFYFSTSQDNEDSGKEFVP